MTGFLAVLAGAALLFLLGHPAVPSGFKVLALTAPPVAVIVWLLVEWLEEPGTALTVAAVYVVIQIALNGLLGRPRVPSWAKITVFVTIPVAAAAWLLIVTADDTAKDPGEDPCTMYYGGVGRSRTFPPQAYCLYEDGSTHNLASGTQFVFWVCFVASLLLLSVGLWEVVRRPGTLVRQFRTNGDASLTG